MRPLFITQYYTHSEYKCTLRGIYTKNIVDEINTLHLLCPRVHIIKCPGHKSKLQRSQRVTIT